MAMGIMALASLWSAKETRDARKDAESAREADRAKKAEEKKKMDAEIAAQEAEQKKAMEKQRQKETRIAKRGSGGYAGTILTQGVAANSDAAKRTKLGVG